MLKQELNTVLAALRYYQKQGLGDPRMRPDDIHDIATDGDTDISMDDAAIDRLCTSLNAGEIEFEVETYNGEGIAPPTHRIVVVGHHDNVEVQLDPGATEHFDHVSLLIERRPNGWCLVVTADAGADSDFITFITDQKQVRVVEAVGESGVEFDMAGDCPSPNPVDVIPQ